MQNYLKEIAAILLSIATITGLIVWLIKELVKKFLQADTERQKNKLLLEHQKFTRLQTEQFDTLKTIFSNLVRTDELLTEAIGILKNGMEVTKRNKETVLEPLVKKIFDTDRHFKQNRIFLTSELSMKVRQTVDTLFICLTKSAYAFIVQSEEIHSTDGKYMGIQLSDLNKLSLEDKKDFESTLALIENIRQTELKELIITLEIEFRQIFGV